jgi:hypothetical protein
MTPLQLWLPTLGPSLNFEETRRDASRAFREWRGESVVWLLQNIDQVVRWDEGTVRCVAVPAEGLDCVRVFHIGKRGGVVGEAVGDRFPRQTVRGLLEAWLSCHLHGPLTAVPYKPILMSLPVVSSAGAVSYRKYVLPIDPGPVLPVDGVEPDNTIDCRWQSPRGQTISPDAESLARNGPLKAERREGYETAIGPNGEVSLRVLQVWPPPLTGLMPILSAIDDIYYQAKATEIIAQSAPDPSGAIRATYEQAKDYISQGNTTRELAWFHTTLLEEGMAALLFQAEEFGLKPPTSVRQLPAAEWDRVSPDKLLSIPEWSTFTKETVPIRRAWGASGLFWALLLDALVNRQSFGTCERCGSIILGKRGKRFCGFNDNPNCFRERRAADTRRCRTNSNQSNT